MSKLYLRFLRIARAVEIQNTPVKNIDSTAMLLLNEIAVQHLDGKNITVTQAMLLSNIASPATVHRKLDELRAAGKPTVPSLLGLEKATNPFLRPTSADLQNNLGLQGAELTEVFAETRRRKDNF